MQKNPILFDPIYMERVWGGRELEACLGRTLPEEMRVGESWDIVDREEAQSRISEGEWKDCSLHGLWNQQRDELFGEGYRFHPSKRFPILIKLLDARDKLSVQVHPPMEIASRLGGEPKTEMWYLLATDPDACIYAGVKAGVDQNHFRKLIDEGRVEEALIRVEVHPEESIFIPSGRLHAIGAGCVIAEIQQNSDTTYRVFDWNRKGLDGQPRELHIEPSLASIDFADSNPEILKRGTRLLANCPFFRVERRPAAEGLPPRIATEFAVWGIVSGKLRIGEHEGSAGTFWMLPRGLASPLEVLEEPCEILEITLPLPTK